MVDEYRSAFLQILSNRPDPSSKAEQKRRDRGFVVVVEGKRSLTPLQELCFSSEQTYNKCYTARYRISAGAVFGTLLVALLKDLQKISAGEEPAGVYLPEPGEQERSILADFISQQPIISDLSQDRLDEVQLGLIERMLLELESRTASAIGKRFVLFCEVEGQGSGTDAEDAGFEEWELARSTILANLPERFGMVFSGVPEGFELIPDDTATNEAPP